MKYTNTIGILGAAVVLAVAWGPAFNKPASAQGESLAQRIGKLNEHRNKPLPPAAVIFGATERWMYGYPVGYYVYISQSSSNAPQVALGSNVADAIEDLLEQGFQIQSSEGLIFRMIRQDYR